MKLEVVICWSILEECFVNETILFNNNDLLKEIDRRLIVVNEDVIKLYEDYFENKSPELVEIYRSFVSNYIIDETKCRIENSSFSKVDLTNINDDILTLISLSNILEDKILLSNEVILETIKLSLNQYGINYFNNKSILDYSEDNILNSYRLPFHENIIQGNDSMQLSQWFKKFLQTENEITIIDNHIYQDADNFEKYILPHISKTAKIRIYTKTVDELTKKQIKEKFKSLPFSNWNIEEIYLLKNKREQHARCIETNKYLFWIDKGMATFGTGANKSSGLTDQSIISVDYKWNIKSHSLPKALLRIV